MCLLGLSFMNVINIHFSFRINCSVNLLENYFNLYILLALLWSWIYLAINEVFIVFTGQELSLEWHNTLSQRIALWFLLCHLPNKNITVPLDHAYFGPFQMLTVFACLCTLRFGYAYEMVQCCMWNECNAVFPLFLVSLLLHIRHTNTTPSHAHSIDSIHNTEERF